MTQIQKITAITLASFAFNIVLAFLYVQSYEQQAPALVEENPLQYHFVWNDDEESIPMEGTPVIIEEISNDTIWLTTIEESRTQVSYSK
jgi:hypothetical protein